MNVLGISGSLRKGSFNSAALRGAQGLAPQGMTIQVAEIGDFPLYNEDVRAAGFPLPIERFRAQIAAADALLFVTPEYNFSVRAFSRTPSTGGRAPQTSHSTRSRSPSWALRAGRSARPASSTIFARCFTVSTRCS